LASLSVFRLRGHPLWKEQSGFGANVYSFTFRPRGLWFLSTTDTLVTTQHLHERLAQRAASGFDSLVRTHDELSVLWPTLLELAMQRRQKGRRGELAHFITPLADGIVFGEMQKMFLTPEIAERVGPHILDFELALEQRQPDYYQSRDYRFLIEARTFVGSNDLRPSQVTLKQKLDGYVRRHSRVTEYFRQYSRLAFHFRAPYGIVHRKLYCNPMPTSDEIEDALVTLDVITRSSEWSAEIARSIESRARRNERFARPSESEDAPY
jgi:hypothetical protein